MGREIHLSRQVVSHCPGVVWREDVGFSFSSCGLAGAVLFAAVLLPQSCEGIQAAEGLREPMAVAG